MKKFSSEFCHNYDTYSFGYANYCTRDKSDTLSRIYEQGFMPYSGNPAIKNVFYLARSARVPLNFLKLTSENRRIAKKFDSRLTAELIPIHEFDITENHFLSFCVNYFNKRHGPGIMPQERLKLILSMKLIKTIVVYKKNHELIAYLFEVSDDNMAHFWYSFYDLAYVNQSLGMWLMLDSARRAQKKGNKYFYVGTVYGEKALYKTAFSGLEYWNGKNWSNDIQRLKQISRRDTHRVTKLVDEWKSEN